MPTREEIADHHAGAILDHIEWARTMKGAISRAEIARFVYDAIGEASAELVRQEREARLRAWLQSENDTPFVAEAPWQLAAVQSAAAMIRRIPINCPAHKGDPLI